MSSAIRRSGSLSLTAVCALLGLTACGTGAITSAAAMPTPMHSMSEMPGMDGHMPTTDGLSASAAGYTLAVSKVSPTAVTYTIDDSHGVPVTGYQPDQTKLMHVYLIRGDLTGFQHVHPTMAPGGIWTAPIERLRPGTWRVYTSFIPKNESRPLVLGDKLTVRGTAKTIPLPAPARSTAVDGYTVTVTGDAMAGMTHPLGIAITKDGKPVTDLQPYLGTLAHLSAIHQGDLAFAHLHPQNADPANLSVAAMLPEPGNWRLFIQFQTAGTVHTAALTLPVT